MKCKYDLSKLLNSAKLAPDEANLAFYNIGGMGIRAVVPPANGTGP